MVFKQLKKYFQILSLDVVAGSVVGLIMAFKVLEVKPWWPLLIIVPLAVWTIYTLDHLMDGIKLKEEASTLRHSYHYKNQKFFILTLSILTILGLFIAFVFLDRELILFGITLGAVILAYQVFVFFLGRSSRILIPKEFIIGLIYTAGIWGGPIIMSDQNPNNNYMCVILIFGLLAVGNTSLLSYFEFKSDLKSKQVSLAVQYGQKKLRTFLIIFFSILLSGFCILFSVAGNDKILLFAIAILNSMCLIMLLMIIHPFLFQKNQLYKVLIEVVFWFPVIMIFA